MFTRHKPPPPPIPVAGNAGTCRNVLPVFCEAQCSAVKTLAFGVSLLLHGYLLLREGGVEI